MEIETVPYTSKPYQEEIMKKILLIITLTLGLLANAEAREPSASDMNNITFWNQADLEAFKTFMGYTNIIFNGRNSYAYCGNNRIKRINFYSGLDGYVQTLQQRHGSFSTSSTALMGETGIQTGIDWKTWLVNYNQFLCYAKSGMTNFELREFLVKENAYLTFFDNRGTTGTLRKVYRSWDPTYKRFRTMFWTAKEVSAYSSIPPIVGLQVLTDNYYNFEGFYGENKLRRKEVGQLIGLIADQRFDEAIDLIRGLLSLFGFS